MFAKKDITILHFLSEELVKFHTAADFTAYKGSRKSPAAVATPPTLFTGARAQGDDGGGGGRTDGRRRRRRRQRQSRGDDE